ncbi:MAG: transcription elongation factor GreA [Candidatus Omnitrophica bacterium]|nr:transcription elongation factor GreA [Candidatus Omnitrophota bacterium]
MENIYLTQQGYTKLKNELEYLKTKKRRQLSEEIGKARALGDISENAEYDAAKDAQGMNEKRIFELENQLARARIIDQSRISSNEALIGATVTVKDIDTGENESYTLVSEAESDFSKGMISVSSPVGKALLGRKKDETVEINVPAGTLKYKIINIERR